ncbi:MAG: hypothetical protein JW913_17600 [Chitinispirillaceae bacterium]|nr:hypothetical protein [Chitinispirillaceae bacterium]
MSGSDHARFPAITSLLLILFCHFKAECYNYSPYTTPAPSRPVCELVASIPPFYDIPQLIEGTSVSETEPPVTVVAYPPSGNPFQVLEREFTLFVHSRLHLFNTMIAIDRPYRHCSILRNRHIASSDDTPSDLFS